MRSPLESSSNRTSKPSESTLQDKMKRKVSRGELQRFGFHKAARDCYAGQTLAELVETANSLKWRSENLKWFIAETLGGCPASPASNCDLHLSEEARRGLEYWRRKHWGKGADQSAVAEWLLMALLNHPDLVDRLIDPVASYCDAEGLVSTDYLNAGLKAQKRYSRTRLPV